jgi:SAM-dependent methyltransferase
MAKLELNPTGRFSDRVAYYIKYRPDYPREVLDVLAAEIKLSPSDVIADIGAGTGISAKLFLANGNVVYGVEPNREMREAAEEILRDYPNFYSVDGSAEATTLPAQSVDVVVAAQAFHWFNVESTRAEAKRILKAGGWCVLLWNNRRLEGTPFLLAYEELLLRYGTDYVQVSQEVDRQAISNFFGHEDWRSVKLPNEQLFDLAGLRGRLLSSSYVPLTGHPNYEPMLQSLAEVFAEHQEDGQVRFEYETQIFYGQLA